jgi:glycosyltransferase involved in cell wall biosynthesis
VAVVGRLVEEKGHDLLFEAARILEQSQMRCEFWVLGDGPLREDLESRAARLFHGTRVRFLGMHPDIAGILPAADVLALPSRYESQGLVLIEAMASGVPVIATSVGGIPDLVRDGETGLLVEPGCPQQLAGALKQIAGDQDLHRRLVQGGLELAREQFDVKRMVREVIHLYEELLDEWGGDLLPGRGLPGEELGGKGHLDFQGEW